MNNVNKTQRNIIIIAIVMVVGIIGYYVYGRDTNNKEISTNDDILIKNENNTEEQKEKIIVHITGAVNKGGIVTLEENSRVADAIEAAGGLKEDADINKINLAYILEDGVKIKIPSINDKEENEEKENTQDIEIVENVPEGNSNSGNIKTGKININKASQIELETLPGIGPSIALKIINYRNENGKFSSIDDLKKINGVGDSKYENIKNLICVKWNMYVA